MFIQKIYVILRPKLIIIPTMNIRQNRLKIISSILNAQIINSQDALQQALKAEGISVTQATLSRDLKVLKVVKTALPDGTYKYVLPNSLPPANEKVTGISNEAARGAVLEIGFSGQFAVVKTRPGYASAVAYDIDLRGEEYILGTIAGDDTILVIPHEQFSRETIQAFLKGLW